MGNELFLWILAKCCVFGLLAAMTLSAFLEEPTHTKAAIIFACAGAIIFL